MSEFFSPGEPRRQSVRNTGYRSRKVYVMPTSRRVTSRQHHAHPGSVFTGLLILAALVLGGLWFWHIEYGTQATVSFTVTRLDDQSNGHSHKYLVFTQEAPGQAGEVFEDTDSLGHLKFNSSDLFAQLQAGQRYTCSVYGNRSHLLSSYRDLLSCTRIST